MPFRSLVAILTLCHLVFVSTGSIGQHRGLSHHRSARHKGDKRVAYDAKDKKYYSVAYARAHHMRDRGGDKLVVVWKSSLPHNAKLSRAMKGIEP